MSEMFVSLGTWNWLICGLVLMALEIARARRFPDLARARRVAGRLVVIRNRSLLADADPVICDVYPTRRAALPPGRTQHQSRGSKRPIPQPACRGLGRLLAQAGTAAPRRDRHHSD